MFPPATCPTCREPVPTDAPEGACPRCMLLAGLGTAGRSPATAPGADEIARHLPQFEVTAEIARGGMGVVWRARQRSLDREIALKVLAPDVAAAPGFAERFRREAKALARLDHPNIVRVHDSGESGGLFWLAMEFVEGTTLRHALREGTIAPDEALTIVRRICDALEYAHAQGVVHRDIKPENVLIAADGRVKVADFGIAKIAGVSTDLSLTGAGQVMGTLPYMSPEQIERPATVDHRADIYSLGVVFYELLTGELPLGRFLAPSEKAGTDARLDGIVLRTLAKEPAHRFQRAADLRTSVETYTTNAAPPAAATSASPPAAAPASGSSADEAPRGWTKSWASVGVALALWAVATGVMVTWLSPFTSAASLVTFLTAAWLAVSAAMATHHGPSHDTSPQNRRAWIAAGTAIALAGGALGNALGGLDATALSASPYIIGGGLLAIAASTWAPEIHPDARRPAYHPLAPRGVACLTAAAVLQLAATTFSEPSARGPAGHLLAASLVLMAIGWLTSVAAIVAILRSKEPWRGLALAACGVGVPLLVPVVAHFAAVALGGHPR